MQDFHKLKVWEKSHQLTLAIYQETKSFPKEEVYGIISQLRRASASIPANIAEGCCRTEAEFSRFLQIDLGSTSELEYHLLLSKDLGYLENSQYQPLNDQTIEIKQMLTALIRKTRTGQNSNYHVREGEILIT